MTQDTVTEIVSVIEPRAAIEPADSAPVGPYTHSQRFDYTGSVDNFIVPPGVTTIDARCWGGGGGRTNTGGGGGFATGRIAVVPGETLRIVVDLGGGPEGGGGMSGVYSQRLGKTMLIAGGGGGGTSNPDARGGAGGGTSGSDASAYSTGGWTGTPARKASGSTGGAGGATSSNGNYGGRGGNTGENGGAHVKGSPGGRIPIPGMGGGGGAGYGGASGGGAGYAGGGGGLFVGTGTAYLASGGAGGSSFAGGPGVTEGRTVPGNGTRAGGKDDPLYQSPVGDAGNRGQVVLQWSEFTVTPGGPPDVQVRQGGAAGYPGVRVAADTAFDPVSVTVTLPEGRGLLFGTSTLADYQLTLQSAAGETTRCPGSLSEDGTSLTFSGVDLQLPGTTVMWVGVGADHDAPLGASSLTFTVGGRYSRSTTVVVTPAFTVSPGEGRVRAERAGAPVYPGVQVRNNGSQAIPLQTVTATLPADAAMRFGTETNPDHQLTVWTGAGSPVVYRGGISDDGRALTFTDVDLAIPTSGSRSVMWVCVSASDATPTGQTSVAFTIGDHTSPSTPIDVV